jgi:hypothetical protein
MIASETSRWNETIQGLRSVRTVTPPTSACAGMPRPSHRASTRRSRRPDCQALTNVTIATAESTNVSVRLPNSMAEWKSRAPCGVNESSVQRGHVGQPRPEAVSRTAPPVSTMPMLAISVAQPSRRSHVRVPRFTPT